MSLEEHSNTDVAAAASTATCNSIIDLDDGSRHIINNRHVVARLNFVCNICNRPCLSAAGLGSHRRVHRSWFPPVESIWYNVFSFNNKLILILIYWIFNYILRNTIIYYLKTTQWWYHMIITPFSINCIFEIIDVSKTKLEKTKRSSFIEAFWILNFV